MPDVSLKNDQISACDPVTLEIVRGAIRVAQAEMEALIERTAISAFIREKKDFYTALFDADGVMAVGSNLPVFGDICTPVFRDFPPETMRAGDLYWYNDCYGSRGAVSHSNDQVLLAPVFQEGRRCGFVMGWAHFSDIGGLRAGSISPDTTDIFQEGIIVPPTKLIDAGRTNEATLKIFYRNSRFPEQNLGDMRALMAATSLGVKRIEEIVARFGHEVVADALRQLLARTRNLVRAKLAETFDYGTHRFTDAIDSDGHGNGPFHLRLALTREKGPDGQDRFIFDATRPTISRPGQNLLMNPTPGTALSCSSGGDPGYALPVVCRRSTRYACARARCSWPKFPPLGMRGLTLMRFLAAVNGLINGRRKPAAHSAYVISFLRGTYRTTEGRLQPFLMSDGIGVGGARGPRRRHRRSGLGAGELSCRARLSGAVAHPWHPRGFLRRGGSIAAVAASCANTTYWPKRCWRSGTAREEPPGAFAGGMAGVGRIVVNPGTNHERPLAPLSDGNVLSTAMCSGSKPGRWRLRPSVRPRARKGAGVLGGCQRPPPSDSMAWRSWTARWTRPRRRRSARRLAVSLHRHSYARQPA
jgi:N-methylhydantoinase B